MQRVWLSDAASTHGARCLDGTPAAYYVRPASAVENVTKFVVYLQGGGWCASAQGWQHTIWGCTARTSSRMGSTNGYPASTDRSDSVIHTLFDENGDKGGIMSADTAINPDFATWNAVWVAYCDSGSFSGNRETPVPLSNGGELWFRGRSM
jgi:O-palmitoleoyl-L-serine hydrolase